MDRWQIVIVSMGGSNALSWRSATPDARAANPGEVYRPWFNQQIRAECVGMRWRWLRVGESAHVHMSPVTT